MANNNTSQTVKYRVNEQIRGLREVRLIDQHGNMVGIVGIYQAVEMVKESGLDLVEVNRNANPPVCKILDYGKFKYEQTKAQKEARKNQQIQDVKEVVIRPATDTHDILVKAKHIKGWLEQGDKVRIVVKMRGREKIHPDQALKVVNELLSNCEPYTVEQSPRVEDRFILCQISPQK